MIKSKKIMAGLVAGTIITGWQVVPAGVAFADDISEVVAEQGAYSLDGAVVARQVPRWQKEATISPGETLVIKRSGGDAAPDSVVVGTSTGLVQGEVSMNWQDEITVKAAANAEIGSKIIINIRDKEENLLLQQIVVTVVAPRPAPKPKEPEATPKPEAPKQDDVKPQPQPEPEVKPQPQPEPEAPKQDDVKPMPKPEAPKQDQRKHDDSSKSEKPGIDKKAQDQDGKANSGKQQSGQGQAEQQSPSMPQPQAPQQSQSTQLAKTGVEGLVLAMVAGLLGLLGTASVVLGRKADK